MRGVQLAIDKREEEDKERRAGQAARDTKDREFKRALILKVALPVAVAVLAMLGFNVKAQHDTSTAAEDGLAEVLTSVKSLVNESSTESSMEHAE
jgi:hypothetical protein